MKKFIYTILSLTLIGIVWLIPGESDVIMAIDPITLSLLISGGTALMQGAGNQIVGNPRNRNKQRRRDLKQTTEQANILFDTQYGNVSNEMQGIDQSLEQLGEQYADLRNLDGQFAKQLGKSYLDTTEGKAILGNIRNNTRKSKDKLRNDSSLMGLSEESYIAGLGRINEAEGGATSGLAANANNNRANLRSSIMNLKNMMGANASTRAGINMNKANFTSNLYGNSFNAASGIMNQTDGRMQNQLNSFNQGMGNASSDLIKALLAGG